MEVLQFVKKAAHISQTLYTSDQKSILYKITEIGSELAW